MIFEVRIMSEYFFVVSGELESLPFAELRAILESEDIEYKIIDVLDQVIILKCSSDPCKVVAKRAAYTHVCCKLLFCCEANIFDINSCIKDIPFDSILDGKSSFLVEVKRIKQYSPHINSVKLTELLGDNILRSLGRKIKVDLTNPDVYFYGVLTEENFVFGLCMAKIKRGEFNLRATHLRPYMHPSSMSPFLSRLLVNLSRARANSIFYDPFCGAGGILIEAALIGCRVIGSDVSAKMIRGAMYNLKHYGLDVNALFIADARLITISKVDSISTDPPYGISSSTMGSPLRKLIYAFIENVPSLMKKGSYMVVATPLWIPLEEFAEDFGLKLVESYLMRVHKSLTRKISILRNM